MWNFVPYQASKEWYDLSTKGQVEIQVMWRPLLSVGIREARGLKGVEKNGLSDPKIEFVLGSGKFETKTIQNTVSPRWDETFLCDLPRGLSEDLVLQLFDWNRVGKNTPLGNVTIKLTTVPAFGVLDTWLPVSDGSGEVHVTLQFSPQSEPATSPTSKPAAKAIATIGADLGADDAGELFGGSSATSFGAFGASAPSFGGFGGDDFGASKSGASSFADPFGVPPSAAAAPAASFGGFDPFVPSAASSGGGGFGDFGSASDSKFDFGSGGGGGGFDFNSKSTSSTFDFDAFAPKK
jgi:hypothetical protein